MSQDHEYNALTKQDVEGCDFDQKVKYISPDFGIGEGPEDFQCVRQVPWTNMALADGQLYGTAVSQRLPAAFPNSPIDPVAAAQHRTNFTTTPYDYPQNAIYPSYTTNTMSTNLPSHHAEAYHYAEDKHITSLSSIPSYLPPPMQYAPSQGYHDFTSYNPVQFRGNNATTSSAWTSYAPHETPSYGPVRNAPPLSPPTVLAPVASSYSQASPTPATSTTAPPQATSRDSSAAESVTPAPRQPAQRRGKKDLPNVQTHVSKPLKWEPFQYHSNSLWCNGQPLDVVITGRCQKNINMVAGQKRLVAYRRNYISVEAEFYLIAPNQAHDFTVHQDLYLHEELSGRRYKVNALAVRIHSVVDQFGGKEIELLQHTPKRDNNTMRPVADQLIYPNTGGVNGRNHGFGHPNLENMLLRHNTAYGPPELAPERHVFERVQFRAATANNGHRRQAQQYFHVIVSVVADVASANTDYEEVNKKGERRRTNEHKATWLMVESRMSRGLVVRGRSPSHYHETDTEQAVILNFPEGANSDFEDDGEGDDSGPGHGGNPDDAQQARPGWQPPNAATGGRSAQRGNNALGPQNSRHRVQRPVQNSSNPRRRGANSLMHPKEAEQLMQQLGMPAHHSAPVYTAAHGPEARFSGPYVDTRHEWAMAATEQSPPGDLLRTDPHAPPSESPDIAAHTPIAHDSSFSSSYALRSTLPVDDGVKFLPSFEAPRHMQGGHVDDFDATTLTTPWDDHEYTNYQPAGLMSGEPADYHDIMS